MARERGSDSPSPGRAPRQPFPGAPEPAPRAALVRRLPPARSGEPAPSAQCPGLLLDGTRAPRLSLTQQPLEDPSHAPQAPPSWDPYPPKAKAVTVNTPSPNPVAGNSQTVLAQEAVKGSRRWGRNDRGGAMKVNSMDKEAVPSAPWALLCSSQGHRKQDSRPPARRPRAEVQGCKWSLLSSPPHSASPGPTPVPGVMGPLLDCQAFQARG